jgi:flagellin-like protein
MISKKGISGVITTVMMILLTIASVVIIAGIVIGFVNSNLEETNLSCFDTLGELEILYSKSFYSLNPVNTTVRIHAGQINLTSVYFVLTSDTESKTYELVNGESYQDVNNNEEIKMPTLGGDRTFIFDRSYNKTSVGAIINGKKCDIADEVKLKVFDG